MRETEYKVRVIAPGGMTITVPVSAFSEKTACDVAREWVYNFLTNAGFGLPDGYTVQTGVAHGSQIWYYY